MKCASRLSKARRGRDNCEHRAHSTFIVAGAAFDGRHGACTQFRFVSSPGDRRPALDGRLNRHVLGSYLKLFDVTGCNTN